MVKSYKGVKLEGCREVITVGRRAQRGGDAGQRTGGVVPGMIKQLETKQRI
jgi:hypothetical protein